MIDAARIIGPGKAGRSLARALTGRGVEVDLLTRHARVDDAAMDCDLLVIATPDPVVAEVAAKIRPSPTAVIAHLAGSLRLDVLAGHPRVASLHPLVAMPNAELGAERLVGAWFAVAGDRIVRDVVTVLDGHAVEVDEDARVAYHAAAVVASNHVVAVLGQAERIAAQAGVPFEAFVDLVRSTVDNVADLGPAAALTGPVARSDWETVSRHLAALPAGERTAYDILANEARKLAFPQPERRENGYAPAREAAEPGSVTT